MTKMAAMRIYSKPFKNPPLQNPEPHDLETWYTTFGTQALQILYK